VLEELFAELKNLFWGLGIISIVIFGLLILPKKLSLKLGENPTVLAIMFSMILLILFKIFN
jgi:Ni,Fe-hydrogenase I cytochrome b subunit